MITRSTSHTLSVRRFIAGLAATILLIQVAAPAVASATGVVHGDEPAHSTHHPGCPFKGKENCPHHQAAAGGPSIVQCGDRDAIASAATGAPCPLVVPEAEERFRPPVQSATPATVVRAILVWSPKTPDTPPPRVPDSL